MTNYKDTGRVYTLQDLFDLGLKIEVGDTCITLSGRYCEISKYLFAINSRSEIDSKIALVSCKQLDKYLEKQAMNNDKIALTEQEDEAFEAKGKSVEWDEKGLPPTGCVCEYYDENHSGKWIKVIVNYSSEWGVVVESVDVAKGTELFFNNYEGKVFRKLETPEQKAKRERDELARDLFLELNPDVFAKRDWEYHKKFTGMANIAFQIVDLGYRKVVNND